MAETFQKDIGPHDPALVKRSIAAAKEFYASDHKLTSADRKTLANLFWQKGTLWPLAGVPIVIGSIMIPGRLQRMRILDAKRSFRRHQLALGFVGLCASMSLISTTANFFNSRKLKGNEAALKSYWYLSQFPPQLGSKYYSITARDSSRIMRDPDTIDWDNEILFPLYLLMSRQMLEPTHNSRRTRTYPNAGAAASTISSKDQVEPRDSTGISFQWDSKESDDPTIGGGSSWDRVRHQAAAENKKRALNQRRQSRAGPTSTELTNGNEVLGWPSNEVNNSMQQAQRAASQKRFDAIIDEAKPKGASYTSSVDEAQAEFDRMLDAEREAAHGDSGSQPREKVW